MDTNLAEAIKEFTDILNTPIGVFNQFRNDQRHNYEVVRNLSFAVKHLEDAQDKLRRALDACLLDNH